MQSHRAYVHARFPDESTAAAQHRIRAWLRCPDRLDATLPIAASPYTPRFTITRVDTARRLSVYRSETAPLIEFYETKGQPKTIHDGLAL